MAHFALLSEDNIVIELTRLNNDDIFFDGVESEEKGIEILTGITGKSNWKKCSYNGSIRNCYPQCGYEYHVDTDTFCRPQPHPSWSLNESKTDWVAPVPMPSDGEYHWDEDREEWVAQPSPLTDEEEPDDEEFN